MGEVYEAVHENLERQVAIKLLRAELARDKDATRRLFHEARATNRIKHPGLVQVSDCGKLDDGTSYIVMEFLSGETLGQRMKRHPGRLPLSHVLHISWQVASALAATHAQGIIHRDAYRFSMTCFQVDHEWSQRRRNKPCPLTAPAVASLALT